MDVGLFQTRFLVPLYDYQCRACGKVTEVRHGFKETYDEACAACNGEMRRVFNPAPIVFKGSGFYVTDSRKSSSSSSSSDSSSTAKSDGATKSEGSAKSETSTKSDAAPSTSSETAA